MRINNLTIRYSKLYKKYQVIAPDKRVLEEFSRLNSAKKWAKETEDFVIKKNANEREPEKIIQSDAFKGLRKAGFSEKKAFKIMRGY
jgi:hypothetical protein